VTVAEAPRIGHPPRGSNLLCQLLLEGALPECLPQNSWSCKSESNTAPTPCTCIKSPTAYVRCETH